MPTLYKTAERCPDLEILADLEAVIDRHEHFAPITKHGLKIDVLVAFADDDFTPALSKNGTHPDAYVKVNGGEMRARGLGDVTVYLDGGRHGRKTAAQRHATLAHELFHISIPTKPGTTVNEKGDTVIVTVPDLDDYGRPVVKLVPDDWVVTGFKQVAEWYGADSMEVISHRSMTERLEQALMPFMGGDADTSDGVPPVVRDAFASLLSIGYTESRARELLDAVPNKHRFRSVSHLIEAAYEQSVKDLGPTADHLDAVVSASRVATVTAR